MKPNFIGIGAQKCATTWIYRNLDGHPEALLSQPKELHFFSANFDRGYRWYESHFPDAASARAVGEYSTSYLCSADAPARAARYNPDFRIIVALRDPVERAYSNHLHEVRAGHVGPGMLTFEECEPQNPMYLEQGRYAGYLRRWLEFFPRDRLLVLLQEDVERDPDGQAAALYRFLGIDDAYRSRYLTERVNVSAARKSEAARRLMEGSAGVLRRLLGARFVSELRAMSAVRRLRHANEAKLTDVVPPMKPETRMRLVAAFTPEMHELAELLGREELPWRSWQEMAS